MIYQNDGNPRSAVSDETAWVMNRLLKNVIENGTGTAAKLNNKVVVGKTGTTDAASDATLVAEAFKVNKRLDQQKIEQQKMVENEISKLFGLKAPNPEIDTGKVMQNL